MDTYSVASYKSGVSFKDTPKKVFVDGEFLDGEYLTKQITTSSTITIQTPETIKNKVHGDKTGVIKMMSIYDATITLAVK